MRNVQRRALDVPAETVGVLLESLASDDDRLWPSANWPALRMDNGLEPGSAGGHGPIRYRIDTHEPGRRVRLVFDPRCGIVGHHEFRVEPAGRGSCVVTHEIHGRAVGRMRLLWPVAVRWLHEALMADLFDNAERLSTGALRSPSKHSPWVRLLRRALQDRPHATSISERIRSLLAPTDLADAWATPLRPAMATDPRVWAAAVFHTAPGWVVALFRVRNALVRLVGIPVGAKETAFATLAEFPDEVIVGTDDVHLDFRASVRVSDRAVSVSTVARANNRRGRLYLGVVRLIHPVIVRSMLARAARTQTGAVATHK